MWDWESWWALELDSKPSRDINLLDQIISYYRPLFARNITVDLVSPESDLRGYRLVLVPNLYLVRDAAAQQLERYVADGGTLLMSFFSGIVDEHDHIRLGGYPAPFRKLLGLWIEEFAPYAPEQANSITTGDGTTYRCRLWSDVINLEGATAMAQYDGEFYAGRAAITRHAFGQGEAYYSGTALEASGMDWLLKRVCETAGVRPAYAVPEGVEAVQRDGSNRSLRYLLNHRPTAVDIDLAEPVTDLLSGRRLSGICTLEPFGVAILVREQALD